MPILTHVPPDYHADAPMGAEPAAVNPYERAGRLEKAVKLAAFIRLGVDSGFIEPHDMARIEHWTDATWRILAHGAGVRIPSLETKCEVIRQIRGEV